MKIYSIKVMAISSRNGVVLGLFGWFKVGLVVTDVSGTNFP